MVKRYKKKDPYRQREAKKYDKPIPSRELILQYLDDIGQAVTREHIAAAFALTSDDDQEALRRRLTAMVRDGQIIQNRRHRYAIVAEMELVKARVIGHRQGFGFAVPDDGSDDIHLTAYQMRAVFPGDRVLVQKTGLDKRGRSEGVIVEVIERNTEKVVGRYFEEAGVSFVTPENKELSRDIIISNGDNAGATNGQFVVAEITSQPSIRRQPLGQVVEILGDHMAPGMEIEIAIRAYNLPHQWSNDVISECNKFSKSVDAKQFSQYKDCRDLMFVTIDGEDAKDFDDAVYCERLPNNKGWRLYVAIADVTVYVKPDTALDEEAYQRGNSVYFPRNVIPMLPEKLSNGLCSLKPNVDRLAMVCQMEISKEGVLKQYQFFEGIIQSKARLTYTSVYNTLIGKLAVDKKIMPHLQQLYQLYKKLHKQRENRGAIEFETTETRIIFDEHRKIKQIVPQQRNEAHRLIEECMLMANVSASKLLMEHKIPILYRIHEGPDPEKLENLRLFLRSMGLRLGGRNSPTPKDYANLLKKIENREDANIIQMIMLRSMSQAVYAPQSDIGHFGLAYESYTHFTSPIRRYPDVLVHRAIKHILSKRKKFHYKEEKMKEFGQHCSVTERRADSATYDVLDWLKCQYMMNKLGETFDGIISSVTNFGIFVELKDIFVEGLVHITALKNDYYHYDNIRHQLKGKRTGVVYKIGDPIKILVAKVDLDDRNIDFDLA